ncbi:MAG: hypothetical protein C4531_05820 [Desulfurivibrio sp.]|nr:MAG: hypothetical protein C4531_05820 [Desulfurivibrio sp.]
MIISEALPSGRLSRLVRLALMVLNLCFTVAGMLVVSSDKKKGIDFRISLPGKFYRFGSIATGPQRIAKAAANPGHSS